MKKPKKEEKPLSGAQEAYEWLQILIVALVTIILVFTFVGRITPVVGESMLPTLHEGDVMLIRDIGYTDPQPGDIVVLTKEFDAARGPLSSGSSPWRARRWTSTTRPAPSMWTAKPWTSPI